MRRIAPVIHSAKIYTNPKANSNRKQYNGKENALYQTTPTPDA